MAIGTKRRKYWIKVTTGYAWSLSALDSSIADTQNRSSLKLRLQVCEDVVALDSHLA
jgi:hypothetical protein